MTCSAPGYDKKWTDTNKKPTASCWDSQSVKGTATPDVRGYDAGKQINGRKRHILVNTLGLLLVVRLTVASVQDRDGARLLLRNLPGHCKKLRKIWVDGGYRGRLIQWDRWLFKFCLAVVCRPKKRVGLPCCLGDGPSNEHSLRFNSGPKHF
jgi:putative transposase